MKHLLTAYAAYNYWANEIICNLVKQLSEEQVHQEIVTSFNSIYKTVKHYWGAEGIWFKRLQQEKPDAAYYQDFNDTAQALCDRLLEQSLAWKYYLATVSDDQLKEELTYQNLAGEQYTQPLYEIIHHVFNHSTFHRGQLITLLRQVGVEKLPSTDQVTFSRLK